MYHEPGNMALPCCCTWWSRIVVVYPFNLGNSTHDCICHSWRILITRAKRMNLKHRGVHSYEISLSSLPIAPHHLSFSLVPVPQYLFCRYSTTPLSTASPLQLQLHLHQNLRDQYLRDQFGHRASRILHLTSHPGCTIETL